MILRNAMVHGFGHASTYILLMYGCSRAEQGPEGLVKNGGIRINLIEKMVLFLCIHQTGHLVS
jgi:hypothetical protein